MSESMTKMTHDMHNRIRDLAYLMWEAAGQQQGLAMDYWLAAEKQVLATMQAAATKLTPRRAAAEASGEKEATQAPQRKAK